MLAEAAADADQRRIVLALLAASPLTDLLEPTRLEPRATSDELLPLAR